MTTVTRCDVCGVERTVGEDGPVGWSSVTMYARRVSPGKLGAAEHNDVCPDCSGALRKLLGQRAE